MVKLYSSQKADVKRILAEPSKGAICGSITGAGKSIIGVETFLRAKAECVLIVAPLNTYDGWERTLREQSGKELHWIGSYTERHTVNLLALKRGKPGWYFVGWEWLRSSTRHWMPIGRHIDGLILDEVHRSANKQAISSRMAFFFGKKTEDNGGYRLALSATWMGNKAEGAYAVAKAVWPTNPLWADFWPWADRHLETKIIDTGPNSRPQKQAGVEKEEGSIVKELPLYIRHEERERCCEFHPHGIQADLPDRVVHRVGVDLTEPQKKIYDQLEKFFWAWLDEAGMTLETDGWPMVLAIRLYQVCLAVPTAELAQRLKKDRTTGNKEIQDYIKVTYPLTARSSKLDALIDILTDIPEPEPVLVFTHSAGIIPVVVDRINKKFGPGTAAGWFGAVKANDRTLIKEAFLNGGVRVIVAQVAAIAEGVDGLQNVCHNEIWLSMSENGLVNIQALGRLMRRGQAHTVNSWQIYARGTIELQQYERLNYNRKAMKAALKEREK